MAEDPRTDILKGLFRHIYIEKGQIKCLRHFCLFSDPPPFWDIVRNFPVFNYDTSPLPLDSRQSAQAELSRSQLNPSLFILLGHL